MNRSELDAAAARPTQALPAAAAAGAPPLTPQWVTDVYEASPAELRQRLLECLLKPLGVLGLVAVAGGAFAALRQRTGWQRLNITLEDTFSYSADQVLELATYIQQSTPDVFGHIAELLANSPAALDSLSGLSGVGGVSAMLLLHALQRRREAARRA